MQTFSSYNDSITYSALIGAVPAGQSGLRSVESAMVVVVKLRVDGCIVERTCRGLLMMGERIAVLVSRESDHDGVDCLSTLASRSLSMVH